MKINSKHQGYVVIFLAIMFLLLSVAVIGGVNFLASHSARTVRQSSDSNRAYFLAESGSEDAIYRLRSARQAPPSFDVSLDGQTAVVTLADVDGNKEVVSVGVINEVTKRVKNILTIGSGASFNLGVQAGQGGFLMENHSVIDGNLYSNGPVVASAGSNGEIRGSVVSAGPAGLVDSVHATGTVYAHTIRNADIDEDAYYQSISLTDVGRVSYPDSPDQAPMALPISDEQIAEWESDAVAGGEIPCPTVPHRITGPVTLGPVKIDCDVEISGNNYEITLTGTVWVRGNIRMLNSPSVKVHSDVGNRSLALIADDPNNRIESSRIMMNQSSGFEGSGEPNSYVLMISQNNSAEMGGSNVAINVGNTVNGDLLVYAGHGEVRLGNSVDLKQVTAYKIHLTNFSVVRYALGMASLLFTSGPGGTWKILNWFEM